MRKFFHTAYGIGAAIILIGATMEFRDCTFLGIDGITALTIGLLTEAAIFFLSAFDYTGLPVDEKKSGYKWVIKKEKDGKSKE